jgi:hypothetical protein
MDIGWTGQGFKTQKETLENSRIVLPLQRYKPMEVKQDVSQNCSDGHAFKTK